MISVIIPVYQVEQYIWDCLESVRAQTFQDFEVIIVNDGTKDSSAVLADAFIQQYCLKNFRIVHKKNGGLSSARNAGLDVAAGEWIFFLDSDDWIAANALEALDQCRQKQPSDLIAGGYQAYDQNTGEMEVWSNYPCEFGLMPEDLDKLHSFSFCWGRLYKRSIIEEHGLRFDERVEYAEDNSWQFDYMQWISAFSYTNEVIYNYRINREGALTKKLVTPRMKYYIAEHMYPFFSKLEKELVSDSLRENPRLLSVTWDVLSTNVVNDILDKDYRSAREKIHSDLGNAVNQAFLPRSKKEKIFLTLWRYSFPLLCVFVKFYYGNFDALRRSKLMRILSKW